MFVSLVVVNECALTKDKIKRTWLYLALFKVFVVQLLDVLMFQGLACLVFTFFCLFFAIFLIFLIDFIEKQCCKDAFLKQVYEVSAIIIFWFCFPEPVPRSSSMAMSAMRAPMARHPSKTQCMTPTWNPPRQKRSDLIPHSTQSARWYSPTILPLHI